MGNNGDLAPVPRVILWPVNCGDSTTVVISEGIVMQVDLHDLDSSEENGSTAVPVLDRLEEMLPTGTDGRPYLAVAAFTHLDKDHCRGAAKLLARFNVGELWFTPRSFVEAEEGGEMCEDAKVLHTEALRRLAEVLEHGADTPSGDRMRLVGYHDVLDDLGFEDYPDELKSIPGDTVTEMDGEDVSDVAEVFFHSPFRDDCDGIERNSSSLGMRIRLSSGDGALRVMLLGDLGHEVLERLLEVSEDDDVAWDVFLAPHHCSKGAVIDDDGHEVTTVTDRLAETMRDGAWVVASSTAFPPNDTAGANPPHRAAREIYERIVGTDHFVCTGENGDEDSPAPVVFVVGGTSVGESGARRLMVGLAVAAGVVGAATLVGKAIRPGDRTVPKGDRRFA